MLFADAPSRAVNLGPCLAPSKKYVFSEFPAAVDWHHMNNVQQHNVSANLFSSASLLPLESLNGPVPIATISP